MSNINKAAIDDHINEVVKEVSPVLPFPVEVFPTDLRYIIDQLHTCLDFPIDYIGSSILYAASLSIGNAYRVEVKRGWSESAMLYMAISGRAGTNKSAPLSWALKPITLQDQKSHKIHLEKLKYYEAAKEMTKKEREESGIDEIEKPIIRKYLLSDFTPEALTQVHKGNLRGIGVYSDELAGWFKNFNRYSKGSEQQFWLSVWSGKAINIDRKGGEPVYIASPHIPVIGTIQTALLRDLGADGRDKSGFLDRMLFVINPQIKKPYWSDTDIDTQVSVKYREIIQHLLDIPYEIDQDGNYQSKVLRLSPAAKDRLYEWQRYNADECNESESDSKAQALSKLEIYCTRLALIIEVLDKAPDRFTPTVVSKSSIEKSIKLVDYFKSTALWVMQTINTEMSPLERLPVNKRKIYEDLADSFTTADAISKGADYNLSKRSVNDFLRDKLLFTKVKQGHYIKKIGESAKDAQT
jgi:hypothetical protein